MNVKFFLQEEELEIGPDNLVPNLQDSSSPLSQKKQPKMDGGGWAEVCLGEGSLLSNVSTRRLSHCVSCKESHSSPPLRSCFSCIPG